MFPNTRPVPKRLTDAYHALEKEVSSYQRILKPKLRVYLNYTYAAEYGNSSLPLTNYVRNQAVDSARNHVVLI